MPRAADGFSLASYIRGVAEADPLPPTGRVIRVVGLLIESAGPRASVGEICEIRGPAGGAPRAVQVVGFREGTLLSVPLGDTAGVRPGIGSWREPAPHRSASVRSCWGVWWTPSASRSKALRCTSTRSTHSTPRP